MSELDSFARVASLRRLADAIDERRAANTFPGISAPAKITFAGYSEKPLDGYGDNPRLLEAIEREIRLSWDELRSRALARLDSSVEQWTAKVSSDLGRSALSETTGEGK